MIDIVRTNAQIGIVADEATAESIAGVDRVGGDLFHTTRTNVGHIVIEACIVNIASEDIAGNAPNWWHWPSVTYLPG